MWSFIHHLLHFFFRICVQQRTERRGMNIPQPPQTIKKQLTYHKQTNFFQRECSELISYFVWRYIFFLYVLMRCRLLENPTEFLMKVRGGGFGKSIKTEKLPFCRQAFVPPDKHNWCPLPPEGNIAETRNQPTLNSCILSESCAFGVAAAAGALHKMLQWMDSQWRMYWIKSL